MKIESAIKGMEEHYFYDLEPLQGELKYLTNEAYENLKYQILTFGISEPLCIWKNDGHNWILSGTQRWRVIRKMVNARECDSPKIPCVVVEAKDREEAKKKILALCCQYGKVDKQELYMFVQDLDMKPEEFLTLDIPNLDGLDFLESINDVNPPERKHYTRVCPKCGASFKG